MAVTVVIDDNELERVGREQAIARLGRRVVGTNWADAVSCLEQVSAPVIVLLVLRRDAGNWDCYDRLRAVGDLRPAVGPDTRVIAAVGPRELTKPVLGLRLAAAGVTEVFDRRDLETTSAVAALTMGTAQGRRPEPTSGELAIHHVGPRCDPSRVIELMVELVDGDAAYRRAFEPGYTQKACGLSRRRAHTLRVKVTELGDLRPNGARSVGGPLRDLSLPRWNEMVAFVNLCRGSDIDDATLNLPLRRPDPGQPSDDGTRRADRRLGRG